MYNNIIYEFIIVTYLMPFTKDYKALNNVVHFYYIYVIMYCLLNSVSTFFLCVYY